MIETAIGGQGDVHARLSPPASGGARLTAVLVSLTRVVNSIRQLASAKTSHWDNSFASSYFNQSKRQR